MGRGSCAVTGVTASSLAALSVLHVAWGRGSSVPFGDRASFADHVAGTPEPPGAVECYAVGGLLAVAAALVADVAPVGRGVRRVGVAGVAGVLLARGGLGMFGRTGSIVPWEPSERFAELDRRLYGPLCLALGAGSLVSITR